MYRITGFLCLLYRLVIHAKPNSGAGLRSFLVDAQHTVGALGVYVSFLNLCFKFKGKVKVKVKGRKIKGKVKVKSHT